jgi:hypothetical protein
MHQDAPALSQVATAFHRAVGQHLTPHFEVTLIEPERQCSLATAPSGGGPPGAPQGAARLRLEDGDASVSVEFYPALLAGLSHSVRRDWARDAARKLLHRWVSASHSVAYPAVER